MRLLCQANFQLYCFVHQKEYLGQHWQPHFGHLARLIKKHKKQQRNKVNIIIKVNPKFLQRVRR